MSWQELDESMKPSWQDIENEPMNPVIEDMSNIVIERYSNDVIATFSFFIDNTEPSNTWQDM